MRGKFTIAVLLFALTGCAVSDKPRGDSVLFLVPGVDGNGPRYADLKTGLRDGGVTLPVQVVSWGAPRLLLVMNFSDKSTHDRAETQFAKLIRAFRAEHPGGTINIIAHSAGCGVTLGALERLPAGCDVNQVVLLAPSVSPTYSVSAAIQHVTGSISSFYSARDTVFLKWRTGNFGTYDRKKTAAAGCVGFDLSGLAEADKTRFSQHSYDAEWLEYGNDGGHFGWCSRKFANKVLANLLNPTGPVKPDS